MAAMIDEAAGPGPSGLPRPAGTCLVLAALNRLAAPCAKPAFADRRKTTGAGRFTKIPAAAGDHRRFRGPMHAVTLGRPEQISRQIAVRMVEAPGVDRSSAAPGMTNAATFIATGNGKAPVAQPGQGPAETRRPAAGGPGPGGHPGRGIPLTWHAYPGDRPDATQSPTMINQLLAQDQAVTAAAGVPPGDPGMTVVFDAGQNPAASFAHLAGTRLHHIGSVPASDCPDLTAQPASRRVIVGRNASAA